MYNVLKAFEQSFVRLVLLYWLSDDEDFEHILQKQPRHPQQHANGKKIQVAIKWPKANMNGIHGQ